MIRLRGARQHHLQDLDLDLVPGSWTAIVGPSGSGKTTLVHDTLVAEGQRRWLGTLSGKARERLGKARRPALRSLTGLPLPVALKTSTGGSDRSTVGTRSGLLDLLRLVWAREGGPGLSRSQFSFNHPKGACEACGGHGLQDEVDPERLVADPAKSIRDGALVPTQPNGYTMYSQVTVDVMDQLCRAHGFTVDTPWEELSEDQRHMVFFGTDRLVVPFGKHDLASRMKWSGITARPRQEGHYKGLVPVLEETLKRNRNDNVLRFVRTVACAACGGRRLGPVGRTTTVAGATLPSLLERPLRALPDALEGVLATPTGQAVAEGVRARLDQLLTLELGHLTLARTLPTLSGGEAQRLALAALLGTELSGLLFALDEPTLGLHPDAQPGLRRAIEAVRARGNTVVTVEHDPDFVRHADRVVALGPGSGAHGGRIVADGPATGDPLGGPLMPGRGFEGSDPNPQPPALWLRSAALRCLQGDDLPLREAALTVVLGRSGAGKSTLVFDALLPALQGRPVPGGGTLDGPAPAWVEALDASPLGRTPRSTPATWTGWFDTVRKRFAATDAARAQALRAGAFAYNGKRGRCPACEGLGVERIRLHLLEDLLRPCPTCDGARYRPEVRQVRWRGLDIAEVLQLTVEEALARFGDDGALAPLLQALRDLGLGHLPLGQPSATLSRGEAQRVRLATTLTKARGRPPGVLLLDEPDRGLHPEDLARLLRALRQLVGAGHTVVAISHHRHVWAAADHRVELVDGHIHLDTSGAPHGVREEEVAATPSALTPMDVIRLAGVATHHLRDLDLTVPKRALIGIVGVSGAGKSSLAVSTLAAEAERRLAETLPFEVRRHLRRLPSPSLDRAEGLTPTLLLRQTGPAHTSGRSTVGTTLDVDALLRLLASRAGTPSGLTAAHFSPLRPEGACPGCTGTGQVEVVDPELLVTDPTRSLRDGALSGTKTGRYLGEPDGQFLATLQAALDHLGLPGDWLDTPWDALPADVQDVALHGSGDVVLDVTWSYQRGKRSGEHRFTGPWPGLLALALDEARTRAQRKDAGAWRACLVPTPCPTCGGVGLAAPAREVRVGPYTLADLRALPLIHLLPTLDTLTGRAADIVQALRPELATKLDDAIGLGLGHLPLDTPTDALHDADRQRLRLARVLGCGLTDLTLVLDEPATGLPDTALPALIDRLRRAVVLGHTVVVVTHRPTLMRAMDHLVELGPGRGADGGQVVAEGPPDVLATRDTATGRLLAGGLAVAWPDEVQIVPDMNRVPRAARVHEASGLAPRATVLDVLGLGKGLQALFAPHGDLPGRSLSAHSPAGRCPTCGGTGVQSVALDVLADLDLPCPACDGRRFRPEVLAVRWPGTDDDVATFLERPVDTLLDALDADPLGRPLADAARRLSALGLGGLAFGRAVATLSGGELQRVVLATFEPTSPPTQVRLVQPTRGLHPADHPAVAVYLRTLLDRGHEVVVQDVAPW